MPPKKAGGKGKEGGPAKMADKENLSRAESEILSLQHLLDLRSHEVRMHSSLHIVLETNPTCTNGLLSYTTTACLNF